MTAIRTCCTKGCDRHRPVEGNEILVASWLYMARQQSAGTQNQSIGGSALKQQSQQERPSTVKSKRYLAYTMEDRKGSNNTQEYLAYVIEGYRGGLWASKEG